MIFETFWSLTGLIMFLRESNFKYIGIGVFIGRGVGLISFSERDRVVINKTLCTVLSLLSERLNYATFIL